MSLLPRSISRLVEALDQLPGVGPRMATRLAFFLMQNKADAQELSRILLQASDKITLCRQCQNLSDEKICRICSDNERDQQTICVVAHGQDLEAIEKITDYTGVFHILHGYLNPIEGITPENLKIKELQERIAKNKATEIILALDPTMEGEATAMYLTKVLKPLKVRITKLARGLPMGSNIEYTDEVTLASAFKGRKEL